MIQASGQFEVEVPDYRDRRPHMMIGSRMVWSLEPGEVLWIPNGTAYDAYSNEMERQRGSGLVFEVTRARPVRGGESWEVLAFGATMLRLQGLDYDALLQVVLPHIPSYCPTCVSLFKEARRSAGLNSQED